MMEALVIVAHGSRRQGSRGEMEKIQEDVATEVSCPVYLAYLQFQHPTLEEVIKGLWRKGIREVAVVPAFLVSGVHVLQDIPETLQAIRRVHPELRFFLAAPLGYDARLADILLDRLREGLREVGG